MRTWAAPAAMAQTIARQFARISQVVANRKRRKKETGGGSFDSDFGSSLFLVSSPFSSTGNGFFFQNMVSELGGSPESESDQIIRLLSPPRETHSQTPRQAEAGGAGAQRERHEPYGLGRIGATYPGLPNYVRSEA